MAMKYRALKICIVKMSRSQGQQIIYPADALEVANMQTHKLRLGEHVTLVQHSSAVEVKWSDVHVAEFNLEIAAA